MILLDTNILIEILKENQSIIEKIESFNSPLAISSITVVELFHGASTNEEVKKLEKFFSLFKIIDINEKISKQSTALIKTYAKSHNLNISNSFIASTSLILNAPLFTLNLKDFQFINKLTFQLA